MTEKPDQWTDMAASWDAWATDDPIVAVMGRRMDMDQFWMSGEEAFRRWLIPAVSSQLTETSEATLLEIGSGLGRLCQVASSQFARVLGVDVSQKMIDQARTLAISNGIENAEFSLSDGTSFSQIPDQSVDVVICFRVILHIPEVRITQSYLRETARVLTPGGICVFDLPTYTGWWRIRGFPVAPRILKPLFPQALRNYLRPLATKRGYSRETGDAKTWTSGISYSRKSIRRMFASAGLNVSGFYDSGMPTTRLVVGVK